MHEGWLAAPDGREVRRYHRNPASSWRWPEIWIDHGLPIAGEPALLKRRRRVARSAALIEWKGLQKAGWRRLPNSLVEIPSHNVTTGKRNKKQREATDSAKWVYTKSIAKVCYGLASWDCMCWLLLLGCQHS